MIDHSIIFRLYRTRLISSLTHSQLFFLRKELAGCRSALDLGSGTDSPMKYCGIPFTVGVDLFEEAVLESRKRGTHRAHIVADINRLEFKPRSFDAVVLYEVLEHLDKADGLRVLDKAESWATQKILISMPNGWLPQPAVGGNPYQIHRSGWQIEEMTSRGYTPYGMVGLRWKPTRFLYVPLIAWAVVSVCFQWLTYRFPRIAYEICYVKEMARSPAKEPHGA